MAARSGAIPALNGSSSSGTPANSSTISGAGVSGAGVSGTGTGVFDPSALDDAMRSALISPLNRARQMGVCLL